MNLTISILVLLAAMVGHVALCIRHHNWWYAFPFPWDWPGDVSHVLHAVAMLAFPAFFSYRLAVDPQDPVLDFSSAASTVLAAYVVLCCVVGLDVLPLITWRRLQH